MNWRSRRFLIPLVIVCLLLAVGVGVALLHLHNSNPSSNMTIIWQSAPSSFTQRDQQNIQTALESTPAAINPSSISGHEFTIIDAQRQGEWAIFSANERVNASANPIPTEPLFFIAHQQGTTWSVWLPGSPGFCDELKQTPDTLLDATDKGYFC